MVPMTVYKIVLVRGVSVDVGRGEAAGREAESDQLHRCVGLSALRSADGGVAAVGGESIAIGTPRAAGDQAEKGSIHGDDAAARAITSSPWDQRSYGLS